MGRNIFLCILSIKTSLLQVFLKIIASEFNNSPAYLGQLFKKKLGESFTNYLNQVGVNQAKELLLYSTLKASEISEKVGYYNVKSPLRKFFKDFDVESIPRTKDRV